MDDHTASTGASKVIGTDVEIMQPIPESLMQMFERVKVCLSLVDARHPDTPLCLVNDAFCKLTGYSRDELIGENCRLLQGEESEAKSRDSIRAMINDESRFEGQFFITNYKKSGEKFQNYLYLFRLANAGTTSFFLGSQFDVSRIQDGINPKLHAKQLWNGIEMVENPFAETARIVMQSANLMSVSAANIAKAKIAASNRSEFN